MKKFVKTHLAIILILLAATLLRIYRLSEVPVSLFGDELDVGYQAYSILKTGRDYSGNFLPLHFHSLAEWRTPLFLYAAVPTVAMFGITPLGVRLPAMIFGVLGVWGMYLLVKQLSPKNNKLTLLASLLLTLSPWHVQYSRASFEATMLLAFLLFGLYFFYKSFEKPQFLWVSASVLVLTPLIYSTAKLFTPLLMLFLLISYKKEIFKVSAKYIKYTIVSLLILGGLTSYAVLFTGGGQRFSYIGVFTDPIIEPEVGVLRLRDALMRGEGQQVGLQPKFIDRVLHNKFTFVGERIVNNYIQALSFDFLFINGDNNPRHMMDGMGMFLRVEVVALVLGVLLFFVKNPEFKHKALVGFWLLAGILPAAITRDGGNHATRLILLLPPLIILVAFGVQSIWEYKRFLFSLFVGVYVLMFTYYLHNYYTHYPWDSERWWHAGWKESIDEIKRVENDYDRVFITMSDEPAWIFFASLYQYDPQKWNDGYPLQSTLLPGFGGMSFIDKYYFGSIDEDGSSIYDLPKYITNKDLYLASVRELPWNLIMEPSKTPTGLKLVKAIAYPSGEPAFYLFTKQ